MARQLENIVRPFVVAESRPVSRPALDEVTDVETLPPATITWGQASDFLPLAARQLTKPLVYNYDALSSDTNYPQLGSGGTTGLDIGPTPFLELFDAEVAQIEGVDPETGEEFGIDEPTQDAVLRYEEVARAVSVVRVTNPSDSEQWVDVERIERIMFRGPDGRRHEFVLNHGAY